MRDNIDLLRQLVLIWCRHLSSFVRRRTKVLYDPEKNADIIGRV